MHRKNRLLRQLDTGLHAVWREAATVFRDLFIFVSQGAIPPSNGAKIGLALLCTTHPRFYSAVLLIYLCIAFPIRT